MRLSLAVAAKGPCDPRPFLKALETDKDFADSDIEIHIVHDHPWPTDVKVLARNIHRHLCPRETSILRLWGVAIAQSTANYVAVLDIQAAPDRGWLLRVKNAMSNEIPLFFGSVEPGWNPRDPRIVGYLIEYVQFKSPLDPHLVEVPGNNLVCQKRLFAAPDNLVSNGFFKTFMIWRLEHDLGVIPRSFDDMQVVYRKPFSAKRYLHSRLIHGRCFAALRHDNPGQPSKLLCIGFTPFLPLLRFARVVRGALPRYGWRALLRYFHLILACEIMWSVGELRGYLFGPGESCDHLD